MGGSSYILFNNCIVITIFINIPIVIYSDIVFKEINHKIIMVLINSVLLPLVNKYK